MSKSTARYSIKLLNKGQVVLQTDSGSLKRFYHQTRTNKWDRAYVKVTYKPNLYNDGWYISVKDLEKAFADFTEKDLIDYANSQQW